MSSNGAQENEVAATLDRLLGSGTEASWTMHLALAVTDLLVLCVVWPLSVWIRLLSGAEFNPMDYVALCPLLLLDLIMNAFQGCYNVLTSPPDEFKRCSKSTLLFVLVLTATTFWIRPAFSYSRGILLIGGMLLLLIRPLARLGMKRWCRRYRWWGYPSVFYVSQNSDTLVLRAVLRRLNPSLRPVALLLHEGGAKGPQELADLNLPCLNGPAALDTDGSRYPAAVFIFLGHTFNGEDSPTVLAKSQRIFGRSIILHESLDFGNLWARTVDVGNLMGLEVLHRLLDKKRMWLKTVTDIGSAVILLVLLLPAFALIAALIWIEDPGPVIFRHTRLGRHGKPFQALKFRTMRRDSNRLLHEVLARDEALRRQWEQRQKLDPDPRVTRVGYCLRRASLDELPQLFNVLKGEMSLIGPRPIVAEEVKRYGKAYNLVAKVRPGITGLWQVSGRNSLPYEERVALDVYYIQNWSIWLDIFVLFKTPYAVFNFSATS